MNKNTPNEELAQKVEALLEQLRELRRANPDKLEYVVIGTIFTSEDHLGFKDYRMINEDNLVFYRNQMEEEIKYTAEAKRFAMMAWSKSLRVVCIRDEPPSLFQQSDLSSLNWPVRYKEYRCISIQPNPINHTLSLRIVDLETNMEVIPPEPFDGFDSTRFVLVDYTKLN